MKRTFETALSIINQATISLELPDTWKRSRIRTSRMGSQNISIFGIQFDFFGSTNINLGKIILIDITIFQDRTFFK